MKHGHPQICLYQPEIPQNTGTVARLVAATHCRLHIVTPCGFSLDDKNLRRAGLDYWPFLDLEIHPYFSSLSLRFKGRIALISKLGPRLYTEIPLDTELIVFGGETRGLPEELKQQQVEKIYRLPMFHESVRSLNLANTVAVVVYDQLRCRRFY